MPSLDESIGGDDRDNEVSKPLTYEQLRQKAKEFLVGEFRSKC